MDIRVDHLSKGFADTAALKDVCLSVRSGELMALLGPSGSGKTTLLRVIAGLEMPDEGRVFFGEEDATHVPVQKRGVGFVFQHYALFRHMTVAQNIGYGLRVRTRSKRPPSSDIEARIRNLLALVQLEDLGARYPGQLSGGQRQRVALARALAVEPRVLLLDEPFGALDAKVRKDLRRWLREIHEHTGQTTIFVTHDQDEALELADRVTILKEGGVEQTGTPEEVHEDPATPFVMSFIGDTTCLPVSTRDGALWYDGTRLSVAAPAGDVQVTELYVRPWDLAFVKEGEPDALAGTVAAIRRSAGGRRASVRLSSGQMLEAEISTDSLLNAQDIVFLRILRGKVFRDT
ncbi:sulfate/molybdate ABC transporter ATP-binding protein [Microvirga brassicacearum]|uniref:Sulfate/molybdate ABC transporter ATP-binding protein n=1 Tax=Microvirga brassicacearum TaxID=2580413 RepID=A0A5N3PCD9_9HYPH|nr:sulfate/molybdate ABC transporter ATP-binding protein [Microvirga brassicacearum]KAB0267364.1 sulfate/molybdate ABC transporter ATP-binding protein [Microvirga brassicacearum]